MESVAKRHVVIVGGHKGTGHMRAAHNLEFAFKAIDPEASVKVIDIFKYLTPFDVFMFNNVRPFFSYHLRFFYRHAHTFVMSSRFAVAFTKYKYGYALKGLEKELPKGTEIDYIATYPMAAVAGAMLKEKYRLKLYVSPTDFLLQRLYFLPEVDGFFMPQGFVSIVGKVSADYRRKIRKTGIPINFKGPSPDKSRIKESLGLKGEVMTALVSMGGNVFGGMRYMGILKSLIDSDLPLQIILVAGLDKKLKKEIVEIVKAKKLEDRIKVFGYVKEIEKLYDAADVFIGKAGGLSVSEAIAKGLPVCLFDALPGQEDHNCDFIVSHKLGILAENDEEMVRWLRLIGTSSSFGRYKRKVLEYSRPESAVVIAQHVVEARAESKKNRPAFVNAGPSEDIRKNGL